MIQHTGSSRCPLRIIAVSALLALLMLQGCAGKKAAQPEFKLPLSPEAQLTYDYLVYMDYRTRLGQALSGIKTPQKINEVARLQRDALTVLNRIIAAEPQEKLYLDKFALYWTSQQVDEARATLKEALEKYPDSRDLNISLANTYLVDNRNADAEGVLKEYLHKKPDDLQVTAHLARIYLEQKKFAQALDILKVIPKDKRTAQIHYLHAKASAGLGLTRQAIRSLNKAVEDKPDFLEAWGELAYMYELEKDYDSAEQIYTKMLEFPDVSNHIRLRLMELCLKLNNPERALKLAIEGPRSKAFLLEAAQLFISGRFYGQASILLDLFAQQKSIPDSYYFFKASIAYEGEENPEKALGYLKKISPQSEHYDRSLQFRAHLLMDLKRNKEALEVIRTGQEKFPEAVNFYLLESGLHAEAGDIKSAKDALLRGNKNVPGHPKILFQLGVLEEQEGNLDRTLQYMEQIISSYPDHADALNFVGYILAERGEQLDRAMVLISRANRLEPDNGYILDSLAWVNYRLGNFEEAWKIIKRAVSLRDKQPELWDHYGDIAAALGKKKSAAKGYRKALKLEPQNAEQIRRKLEEL
ncbi:tetratricopeptide repeat protein [Desulfovibrio sp. JC010]|uniref:tetratricopeptide repeat protein n=1 Tax=Desulfovibrio sp. JC010 TaxID=2593641 RepID=UPI0013D6385B|nr:tetratricopeptide repeat protein [Desulfovibrio sp. JC010]NDV27207.1 tetratricopeptide repeat protein [Desulfovibrio sp. JC010]